MTVYQTTKINTMISKEYDSRVITSFPCIYQSIIMLLLAQLVSGLVGNFLFINWYFISIFLYLIS